MTSTQDVEALVTDSPISVVCVIQIIIFADFVFEQIVKEGYVDDTQFDKTDIHYDP